jgi:crotonobetainyl-CoA:carnitine CoA-transferase CaiB-like acyl-CoA transferase
MKKMGLDYQSLCAVKPDIILARVSAFGPDGPYAHRVGFDSVAQGMSGAMSLTGFPGAPIKAAVPYCDYGTALHTAFGVAVALLHRERTGEGQIVDGALLATGVTFMQALIAERSVAGVVREQRGNAAFYSAPADTYRTRDGWIVIQTIGGDMFARWARMVGREEMTGDPRFADDLSRADHREFITQVMSEWMGSRTTAEAIAELEKARVPAGTVYDLDQVLNDPQVEARELFQYVEYPGAPKPVPLANTAVRLSATPGGIRHRAPMLGEHTDEVLREIGYSADEIAELRAAQAV